MSGPSRRPSGTSLGVARRTGPQGLGARAPKRVEPPVFRRSEKFIGRGLAKGWESAETAAADVGAWQEAGTGYPP